MVAGGLGVGGELEDVLEELAEVLLEPAGAEEGDGLDVAVRDADADLLADRGRAALDQARAGTPACKWRNYQK